MFKNLFTNAILKKLSHIKYGRINIWRGNKRLTIGNADSQMTVDVWINHERTFQRISMRGDVGAAESYMDGDWECSDLTALIRIMIHNLSTTDRLGRGLASLRRIADRWQQKLRPNNRRRSRANIKEHYDLGNDFFSSFLDRTMSYSSAIFRDGNDSLESASIRKMQHVCDKLRLSPSHHLLEIGTGWGGLALFAAENYGCQVTTTTISREQYDFARRRIAEAGMEHKVTVLQDDYRDLNGKFDRIVSIEMIEAIGHKLLKDFFSKCDDLLSDHGLMVMQAIVIRDQRFKMHTKNIDFMRRYVFPGGCLPSNTALLNAMTAGSDFRLLHLEDIGAHYPPTLRAWLQNFEANQESIDHLGLDLAFKRMWRFYLCYCEAAFIERQVNNIQAIFAGPASRLDVTEVEGNGATEAMPGSPQFVGRHSREEVVSAGSSL